MVVPDPKPMPTPTPPVGEGARPAPARQAEHHRVVGRSPGGDIGQAVSGFGSVPEPHRQGDVLTLSSCLIMPQHASGSAPAIGSQMREGVRSSITKEAADELGLEVGKPVIVVVKASDVILAVE